jgi:hypothetical protein
MTSKKPTPKHKSKSNSLKNSLKLLAGGENENNTTNSDKPKSTGFFSFLDKYKTEKPADFNATNAADTDIDKDKDSDITFKSNKLISALSANEEASFASNGEAKPSTGWFIFRVIIVLIILLVFALNLTGYLDNVLESIKELFYKYIAPTFIKIGLMKPSPVVASRSSQLPGDTSKTGTNTINQLDSNVGAKPVTITPPVTETPTAATPSAAATKTSTKTSPTNSAVTALTAYRSDPNLKPIPIQPNERRTPLVNKGESARPPASQPAPYNEQLSREKEKQESVKKALEYALKHQQPMGDNINDGGLRIRRTKPGYCYIGEDRGFRSCIQVGPDVECMSGDIFPTMDVCVNPRLRA